MPGPTSKIRRKILFVVVILLAALALLEVLVRSLWDEAALDPEGRLSGDPRLRWALTPSKPAEFGGVWVQINRHGYRGPDFSLTRPPCTFRIYAAGDSSVFGHGVRPGKAFVELLPGLLREHAPPGLRLEAINGAVPGFSSYQSLSRLKESGWGLSPDLLIVANLWSDAASTNEPDRLFFDAPQPGLADSLLRGVGLAAFRVASFRWLNSLLFSPHQVDVQGMHLGRYPRVSPPEYVDNLRYMVRQIRRRGGAAVLVLLPHPSDQLRLDDEQRRWVRKDIASRGWRELEQPHRQAMRRVSRETGAPLVDMAKLVAAEQQELFGDPLHPNAGGNALIARELKRTLLGRGGLFKAASTRCGASHTR